jgi:GxxExxY protein
MPLIEEPWTGQIIGAAIEVHRELGPGLLESAYEECLRREMQLKGLRFERQVALPLSYKGVRLDCGYRMDVVVEDQVVVELKCADRVLPVHEAQLLSYMKMARKRFGLLINFHVPILTRGLVRRVL